MLADLSNNGIYYTRGDPTLSVNAITDITRATTLDMEWAYTLLGAILADTRMPDNDYFIFLDYLDNLPPQPVIEVTPSPFQQWWEVDLL